MRRVRLVRSIWRTVLPAPSTTYRCPSHGERHTPRGCDSEDFARGPSRSPGAPSVPAIVATWPAVPNNVRTADSATCTTCTPTNDDAHLSVG
jgi:hypothetical protein